MNHQDLHYWRQLRAVLILDAFQLTSARQGLDSHQLADAYTAIAAGCGPAIYEEVRRQVDNGEMPLPGAPTWITWRENRKTELHDLLRHLRACPICHGPINPGDPTERSAVPASSGPGFSGPLRHRDCPDIDELKRCPDLDCRTIMFPPPRVTLHAVECSMIPAHS